ncbi:MAG: tRNA (N(6)-L-threonylcarbamoyladenosine(37)-C(2))-methylthiotransferase MtaB [Halobacteriovoraceae bacterium]|nr:tRNA (N(6)-L-threonylcarbamoyladenosine(37)-C(2))-methylthiotransferase MtaB [Halobacteriovoraceae bacterium]|tara:strand:- start:837 stop:2126 length:1290 start_codon:yes stop_codon:yes gene_type:complete
MNKEDQKTVAFHTLGCRLNMAETGQIAQGFVDRGYKVVSFGDHADVTFLNTCTVTDGADSSCRNLIRKAHKISPEGKVVVAGCYAQMEADKIEKMTGVDLILGTNEKYKVFDYLGSEDEVAKRIEKSTEFWGATTTEADSHTRAFLKIQDGCNYVCSFCIIPQARGRSRTIAIADAKSQAQNLIDTGFKEIVLTGVNIGEYERSSGEKLEDLIREVSTLAGLKRLRLSSVEPNTITKELLQVLQDSGVYQEHFHIPMQSGSDDILKSMRRKYDVNFYKDTIAMVRDYFPNASIGADMIVGYPGETEEQFYQTYDLARELGLTHFHIFPYSKRKNTTAARLENHIQSAEKKRRVKALIELGAENLRRFSVAKVGETTQVLFEREKDGYFEGYTPHYLKVRMKSDHDLANQIKSVKLESFDGTYLNAQIMH